ncbi:hypothetical protein J2X69_003988 [Algoriphagus sp. 4150]|uniref:hypothetical protein n=1 Tax=Algoriphagus sp. 4150 TaxID=2817756 RepID=UPI00285A3133|nr:hypothetical protein [Algoriphagus sp. 4150]MDR7131624.1 hypothetical protein [Algoriphagus sp. 4150]
MIKQSTILGFAFSALLMFSNKASGQTTTFDYMHSNVGSQKTISWNTSSFGSGFGHRLISLDPGGSTTLNLQARHNSATWKDALVINSLGNVGINTKTPTYTLSVNGVIGAREVNVTTTGWADYVFRSEYKLIPLSELEAFIRKNGHLPGVPKEAEVMENGINLAEMNVKLLEKVEELTLYVIQLKSELDKYGDLQERLKKLEHSVLD